MDLIFLFKGMMVGFMASIPLGPIGVLCIQRTINSKFKSGFISGLGATCADSVFAIVAIFFLSIVTVFIKEQMMIISLIGGAIIMAIGISIFTKKITSGGLRKNRNQNKQDFKYFISTFFLTLTNPAFIFVFVGLFASLDISNADLNIINAVLTVVGVSIGSAFWWFALTSLVNVFRNKFRPRHLIIINKTAGALIFCLGVSAILLAILDVQALDKIM